MGRTFEGFPKNNERFVHVVEGRSALSVTKGSIGMESSMQNTRELLSRSQEGVWCGKEEWALSRSLRFGKEST